MDKLIQERSQEPNECKVHSSFYNGERGPVRFYRLVSNNLQIKKGCALDLRLENFLGDFLRDEKDWKPVPPVPPPKRKKSEFRIQGIDKSVLLSPSNIPMQAPRKPSQFDQRRSTVNPKLSTSMPSNNMLMDRNVNPRGTGIAYPKPIPIMNPQPLPVYYPPAHTDKRLSMAYPQPQLPIINPANHNVVNAYISRY
jgi:hypothetical protein